MFVVMSTPLHTHARAKTHRGVGTLREVHTRSLVTYNHYTYTPTNAQVCARMEVRTAKARGGREGTALALGTIFLHRQSHAASGAHSHTEGSHKHSGAKEAPCLRGRPWGLPSSHCPPHHHHHHSHTEQGGHHFPLLPRVSSSFPCSHPRPRFLTDSGPIGPVPLPSELGWALLFAEISQRGRAIFCQAGSEN